MNSKPHIVCLDNTSSIHSAFNEKFFSKYFSLSIIEDRPYSADTLFVYTMFTNPQLVAEYANTHKMIFDFCWETPYHDHLSHFSVDKEHLLLTDIDKFFWFNERNNDCVPQQPLNICTGNQTFFMPIKRISPARTLLYRAIDKTNSIYSYVDKGIVLEGNFTHDRFYNSEWYNQTQYSVVVETNQNCVFVTEKTFKPIQYGHPFMIYSGNGHLKLLKSWGFETFDCVFDESYDDAIDLNQKIKIICENAKSIEYTPLIEEKIKHNYDLFWTSDLPERAMYDHIVKPILEFVN